jgi:hypothetical protein
VYNSYITCAGQFSLLPPAVRDALNRRPGAGQPHEEVLRWLNPRPKRRRRAPDQAAPARSDQHDLAAWLEGPPHRS